MKAVAAIKKSKEKKPSKAIRTGVVCFRINPILKEKIEEIAAENGLNISTFITIAIFKDLRSRGVELNALEVSQKIFVL